MQRGSQFGMGYLALILMAVPCILSLTSIFRDDHPKGSPLWIVCAATEWLWLVSLLLWAIAVLRYWYSHAGGESILLAMMVFIACMLGIFIVTVPHLVNREEASGTFFLGSFSLLFFSSLTLIVLGIAKKLLLRIRHKAAQQN